MDFLRIIKEAVIKEFAFPSLVKVEKVTCSASGYSIDGRGLRPGSFEITTETFKEVPISPLWADNDGRGLYAPPSVGQIVVVSYIEGNRAFPVVSGIYAENYVPAASAALSDKKFTITDGKGMKVEFVTSPRKLVVTDSKGIVITVQPEDPQQFTIEDGKGEKIALYPEDKLLAIHNDATGLKEVLDGIIGLISGIKIIGGTVSGGRLTSPANLDSSLNSTVSSLQDKVSKLLKK